MILLLWKGAWHPRQTGSCIGRLYFVAPRSGEKYYLRVLLHHVRGAKSWEEIRTVNGHVCPTMKEPCVLRGLFQDNQEWHLCMTEASLTQTASSLRNLFAMILDFNHPEDALRLWASHRDAMMKDKRYAAHQERHIHAIPNFVVLENEALWDVECILQTQGKSLRDFGWVQAPTPPVCRDPTTSVMA